MRIDFSWITLNLAIGGEIPKIAIPELRLNGISYIIDMRAEDCDDAEILHSFNMEFLRLPTPDLEAVSQEMLWKGVQWVSKIIYENKKVLIHCQHGIGRSPLLACCILVATGMDPLEAVVLAKKNRTKVSPTPDQLHAFITWVNDWYKKQGRSCPLITWPVLAEIVYHSKF